MRALAELGAEGARRAANSVGSKLLLTSVRMMAPELVKTKDGR